MCNVYKQSTCTCIYMYMYTGIIYNHNYCTHSSVVRGFQIHHLFSIPVAPSNKEHETKEQAIESHTCTYIHVHM